MPWWGWLLLGLGLGVVEVTSMTFVILWIAIAALVTTALSAVLPQAWMQWVAFAIISIALFLATRPLARQWKGQRSYPVRQDTLTGQHGVVVTTATPSANATVRVQGELWSAQASQPLRVGEEVEVQSATSTVLHVQPVSSDSNRGEDHR